MKVLVNINTNVSENNQNKLKSSINLLSQAKANWNDNENNQNKYKSNINCGDCCLHYIVDVTIVENSHLQILHMSSKEKNNATAKHMVGVVAIIHKKLKYHYTL